MNRTILVVCLLLAGSLSAAQAATQLWKLETRRSDDEKQIFLPVLVERPEMPAKGVVISLDAGNNKNTVKEENGIGRYGQPTTLITRNRQALLEKGLAILTPGTPTDRPEGLNLNWREGRDHRRDLEVLVSEARKQFPGSPVVLHGYFSGATSVLAMARARSDDIDGFIITSGELMWHRNDALDRIKTRGLIIQPLSHRCDAIPTPEAREVAAAAHWQLIEAGDSRVDTKPSCSTGSRAGLTGLDAPFSDLLARWVIGEPIPSTLGKEPAALAYTEVTAFVPGATYGLLGKRHIEISLFTPPGKGPFPLFIFNHGDVTDGPALTRRIRFRDMYVANELLALGFAVAMPARPGVGRSEGLYDRFSGAGSVILGSASHLLNKGREQGEECLAAIAYLRTLPNLDSNRIVIAGQSAGGFAASIFGMQSTQPEWLKAIVNFSGGRTDTGTDKVAKGLNAGMVGAFRLIGEQSKVPSLWIFAENDSRYSADTIRASHEAFTKAGGNAKLLLYPASKNDGHAVYHEPEKWRTDLRNFMEQQGLVKPVSAKTAASAPTELSQN